MAAEERFGRWIAVGVPLFVLVGLGAIAIIHLGKGIAWFELLFPCAVYVGVQIAFYSCAFWVGRLGRKRGILWPMALLAGFYCWGTGLLILGYGAKWGFLPPFSVLGFSLGMVLLSVVSVLVAVFAKDKILGR